MLIAKNAGMCSITNGKNQGNRGTGSPYSQKKLKKIAKAVDKQTVIWYNIIKDKERGTEGNKQKTKKGTDKMLMLIDPKKFDPDFCLTEQKTDGVFLEEILKLALDSLKREKAKLHALHNDYREMEEWAEMEENKKYFGRMGNEKLLQLKKITKKILKIKSLLDLS